MTSFKKFMNSQKKKNTEKYSCFYKYLLSLFIHILQILSSKQASSFIICQP